MREESVFLEKLSTISGSSISFNDKRLLPGTAIIDDMPIDISIIGKSLILNCVGEFGGDHASFRKSQNRGKGKFKRLMPYIATLLQEMGMEPRIYLTPLSPVWKRNYSLVENIGAQGNGDRKYKRKLPCWYLDLTSDPELLPASSLISQSESVSSP